MSIASLVEEINLLIKDREVKYILFDEHDPDEDAICSDIVESVNRLIHMLFLFFYSIYLNNIIDEDEMIIQNNRVIRNFEKVFKTQKLNIDFMIFIITELQISPSSFKDNNINDYLTNGFSYQYWKNKIKKAALTSRSEDTIVELLQSFVLTLKSTPLLRQLSIEPIKDEKNIDFKVYNAISGEHRVNSYQTMYFDNEICEYFVIDHIENNSEIYMPVYKVLGKECFYTKPVKPLKKSYLEKMMNQLYRDKNLEKQDALLMNKLYGDNFDRIRVLALSIADVLKDNYSIQIKLRNKFLDDIDFAHQIGLSNIDSLNNSQNWDNLITILLIEVGPSELLYTILDDTEFIFKMIINNISMRINDNKRLNAYIKRYEEERRKIDKRIYNDHFSSTEQREAWFIDYEKMLMVKTIINYVSQNSEGAFPYLVEPLPIRLKHYREIVNSKRNYKSKIIETNYLFENTLKFLLVFYEGLIAYSIKNMELMQKENVNELTIDRNDGSAVQEACEAEFIKAARAKISTLNKNKPSFGLLISQLRDLEKSTYVVHDHRVNILQNGYALESIIGRYNICDMKKLNSIINGSKSRLGFANIINQAKHGNAAVRSRKATRNDYKEFFERGMDLWMLLMKNEEVNNNHYFNNSISFTPIYPYVIQFTMNKKQKDGYSVNCYSMKSIDTNITDIKLLSSKQHDQYENYYCIPNASSSTDTWWIEPFYIRCDKVDELFLELKEGY